MNGLLHRIAARAAGTALLLRADVGPQSAVGGAGAWDGADAPGRQVSLPAADVRADPRAPTSSPLQGAASSAQAAPHAFAPFTLPAALAAQGDASGLPRDGPPGAPRPPAARLTPAPADALDPSPSTPRARQPPLPAGDGPMPWPAAAFDPRPPSTPVHPAPLSQPPALPAVATAAAAARPAAEGGAARLRANRDDPAPLLPAGPRPAPLAPTTTQRPTGGHVAGAAPAAADPDVHIHIGRIDVTAVRDTPAPRRRADPAPAPLSLDGYLAQRGRT